MITNTSNVSEKHTSTEQSCSCRRKNEGGTLDKRRSRTKTGVCVGGVCMCVCVCAVCVCGVCVYVCVRMYVCVCVCVRCVADILQSGLKRVLHEYRERPARGDPSEGDETLHDEGAECVEDHSHHYDSDVVQVLRHILGQTPVCCVFRATTQHITKPQTLVRTQPVSRLASSTCACSSPANNTLRHAHCSTRL